VSTKRGNKVSKESVLCGSDLIGVEGKTIIGSGCIIRGDFHKVTIGQYCILQPNCVLRPPDQRIKGGSTFIPLSVGDHVVVGEGSVVQAAQIGSFVQIGNNCVIGKRSVISSCCMVLDNTVLGPATVMPPFSIYGGSPGVEVGRLNQSWQHEIVHYTKTYYKHFQPLQDTNNNEPSLQSNDSITMAKS